MKQALILPLPAMAGLAGFTSTRQGGISQGDYDSLNLGLNTQDHPADVVENRRRAFARVGRDAREAVYIQQVHGQAIKEATAQDSGRGALDWNQGLAACDAVWTRERGLPLVITHADCLAVVLVDPHAGLLGMAHAGWRGALAGLPAALVRRLMAEGSDPKNLRAVLSPCLGPGNLELSEKEARLFEASYSDLQGFASPVVDGHFYLDLWALTRRQLTQTGMDGKAIQGQELDTASLSELFYSYRRDQGKTGRMVTAAWLQ